MYTEDRETFTRQREREEREASTRERERERGLLKAERRFTTDRDREREASTKDRKRERGGGRGWAATVAKLLLAMGTNRDPWRGEAKLPVVRDTGRGTIDFLLAGPQPSAEICTRLRHWSMSAVPVGQNYGIIGRRQM